MRYATVAAAAVLAGCLPHEKEAPGTESRRQVWAELQPMAAARGLDPYFVFALVGAESGFNRRARSGRACGLLQITPEDWRLASSEPFEPAVWDGRINLAVGMDRLASAKAVLEAKGLFSYSRLWAVHRYGLDFVARRDFEIERVPRPSDAVGRALWAGESRPLEPPK